jgi:AraC-like DNA-binding protein
MKEFGTVYGATQNIRANRLEERLRPLVPFPHRHAFYHLVFITSGSGWHDIDFHRYEATPGKLFLMKPGQVHSWQLSPKTQGFVIEFEESSLPNKGADALLLAGSLSRASEYYDLSIARLGNREQLVSIMHMIVKEYENQAENFEISLRSLLVALLIEISRLMNKDQRRTAPADPLFDRFFTLIEEHFQKEHEVAFYANALSTTAKALTMRATRAFGKSARTIIQERLLLEAKRLLAYSDLSIAEIAYELGFEDPNYFTRFFKGHVEATPGAFRSEVRERA